MSKPSDHNTGSNEVIHLARDSYDPYDVFGWVQGWRSAICDALLWDWGYLVPGFNTCASGSDEDSFELEEIRSLYVIESDGTFDSIDPMYWHVEDELKYALKILDRYREWVRIAGKDY